MRLAIVVPAYNEEESLARLLPEISEELDKLGMESDIFVIDDGSSDNSSSLAERFGAVVLRSHRNNGKSAALQAGFDRTLNYDIVITMDGDGQDDPSELSRMIEAVGQFDLVIGWKEQRQDSRFRRWASSMYARLVQILSGSAFRDINSGYKAYRRRVLDSVRLRGDYHRVIPLLAQHAGFSVGEVAVNHRARFHGRSRYGLSRAFRGPIDLLSAVYLMRFGGSPLRMFALIGGAMAIAGGAITGYLGFQRMFLDVPLSDRPILLLGILLVVVGVQVIAVGLLGEMIAGLAPSTLVSSYRELAEERATLARYVTDDRV